MPRWLWITAAVLLFVLGWQTHHGYQPITPVAIGTRGSVLCALPEPFTDSNQPLQTDNDGRMPPFRLGAATVTPLDGFSLQARVLSREDYSWGTETNYSPTDLALGWNRMADPEIYEKLNISQGGRWFHYSWGAEGPPIPLNEIVSSSANMHMIPSDTAVAKALSNVRQGDTIRLNGWLVEINADEGWHWRSSTSRDDSGGGACEVVYVCSISTR